MPQACGLRPHMPALKQKRCGLSTCNRLEPCLLHVGAPYFTQLTVDKFKRALFMELASQRVCNSSKSILQSGRTFCSSNSNSNNTIPHNLLAIEGFRKSRVSPCDPQEAFPARHHKVRICSVVLDRTVARCPWPIFRPQTDLDWINLQRQEGTLKYRPSKVLELEHCISDSC